MNQQEKAMTITLQLDSIQTLGVMHAISQYIDWQEIQDKEHGRVSDSLERIALLQVMDQTAKAIKKILGDKLEL